MKSSRVFIVLHPVFIVCLFMLLCNDITWKYEYHNALTGKLSDFTGLILLALFLTIFIRDRRLIIIICLIGFTCWKSPAAQPLINLLNSFSPVSFYRIVDATDLLMLPAVLVIYLIRPPRFNGNYFAQRLLAPVSATICLFAFCNTSTFRRVTYPLRDHEVRFNETVRTKKTEKEILDKLDRQGVYYYQDSIRFYPLAEAELYFKTSSETDSMIRLKKPDNAVDSGFYVRNKSNAFYVIPEYLLDGEKLRNIEFFIYEDERKRVNSVFVESFRSEGPGFIYDDAGEKKLKAYKKHFKKIFGE